MVVNYKYAYSEITGKIIGLAIKVHKALGPGFPEKFYEKALLQELTKANIKYMLQQEIKVKYENTLLGIQKLDLIVENKVVVELKVISGINEITVAQIVSYLKASGIKVGLILNFAKSKLEIKHIIV